MILPGITRKMIKTEYLDHEWEGSIIDLIDNERIPFGDRLRLVIDHQLISDKLLRLFSIWCARRVMSYCPRKPLEDYLNKMEQYVLGKCGFSEVKEHYLLAIESSPKGIKSIQLEESESAVYSTLIANAKDAAKGSSFHSLVVLSQYNDRESIQKKHLWKIQDLVLTYLTSGEVEFILRNDHPYVSMKGKSLK